MCKKDLSKAILIVFLFPMFCMAQTYEVGVFMGVSGYQGDLVPEAYESAEFNLAYGVNFRYNMYQSLSFKASLNKGKISGADRNFQDNFYGHATRNLSFESDIYEFAVQAEYNLFGFNVLENIRQFSPYVFGGIAVFKFNPRAFYKNRWFDLQPLGTEGQGLEGYAEPYKLTQFSIPMGAGLKVSLSDVVNMAFEVGLRKTFTDYLDDVGTVYPDLDILREQVGDLAADLSYRSLEIDPSVTSNPAGNTRGGAAKDWYFFSGFTLTFNIGAGYNNNRYFRRTPIPKGKPIF